MRRVLRYVPAVVLILAFVGVVLQGSLPVAPINEWVAGGNPLAQRTGACAVTLADGNVLIAGGVDAGSNPLASAEIVSKSDGSFSAAAPMLTARSRHACAALPDGRVLVMGGVVSGGGITNDTEIYDPASGTWSPGPPMSGSGRAGHTASVLSDGKVVVAGGENGSAVLASVEIYDPDVNTFAPAGSLNGPRKDHGAAVTLDGWVWIGGGQSDTEELATVEMYDPATGSSTPGQSLAAPRSSFVAMTLPNNAHVLIAGGSSAGSPVASAELYRPWTSSFVAAGPMAAARAGAAGAPLGVDGYAIVADGADPASSELFGFATVKTDKADYSPGETVTITGRGWQPGETVTLSLREIPLIDEHQIAPVVADANGNIISTEFVPDQYDIGITFILTATGVSSGLQAQNKFTDAPKVGSVTVGAQSPSPVTAGNSATYTVTVTRGSGPGSPGAFTATLSTATTLPVGATASFSPNPVSFTPSDSSKDSTLTISTTGTTPAGTTAFTVKAATSASDFATGDGSLVVETPDTTPPVVTITFDSPPDGSNGWYKTAPVTGTVSATDPSDVTAISCTDTLSGISLGPLDPGTSTTASKTFSITGEGTHSISCTATDTPGNTGAAAGSTAMPVSVMIDTIAPDTVIDSGPSNPTNDTSATFTFHGSDATSGVASFECKLDGGSFSACSSGLTYSGLATGAHTFYVRAIDNAGNTDTSPASYAWVINAPPGVSFDPSSATFSTQYSDAVSIGVIATDDGVPGSGLTISTQWNFNNGSFSSGLPGNLAIDTPPSSPTSTTWTVSANNNLASGTYVLRFTVGDGLASTTVDFTLTITKEDATATFDSNNPTAIPVGSPGGSANAFSLKVDLREAYAGGSEPNPASTSLQAAGDINNATITMSLSPVGPGSSYNGNCSYTDNGLTGYDKVRTATCTFAAGVSVNAYSVLVTVTGSYYTGSAEDVITIYDPSLGFTTGGGFFYWPDTEDAGSGYLGDRTNFGFNMKYNKKGTSPQGNVLVIRHRQDGSIVRLKSNSVDGLALGEDSSVPMGWATINGKATFFDSAVMTDPIGNQSFFFYVEDRNEPGTGTDKAWVQVTAQSEMSLPSTAAGNALTINGGNIVVPHSAPGRTK